MISPFPAENFRQKSRRFRLFMTMLFVIPALSLAALHAYAQPVPQIKPNSQKITLQQILEQQMPAKRNSGRGKYLGEIREESPLLPPPQPQNSTPAAPQLQFTPAKPRPTPPIATIIAAYPLNEALLTKLEKIHMEILRLPDTDNDDAENDISGGVDVLVKAMEKRPDIIEILGRNLMNTRDYVIAMQAVSNALANASGAEEAQIFGENNKISAENLAFGKKYTNRIRNLLEE